MATSDRRRGMTGPISEALPTLEENRMSDALVEELKRQNNYESSEATQKRRVVLESLKAIAIEFVKDVRKAQGAQPHEVEAANAALLTFGGFRLGVFGPGSDIDTLIVGPRTVSRSDFFERFPDLLVKRAPKDAITSLTCIEQSRVPLIGFEYSGIAIDLVYSQIKILDIIPDNFSLSDNRLLSELKGEDIDSLNGNRTTALILELVPQPAVFKTALRAVKLWAQRRAIYANIVGFCGGVAWAMLLARVCQLYPQATSSTMVLKFFRIIESWNWPTPVLLKPMDENKLGLRVWNPKLYRKDGWHLMPIITPAYPEICSTNTVLPSTLAVMQKELKRGGMITDKIMTGKASWKDLFVKHTFFTQDYKYYLSVTSSSTTQEAHKIWSGRVESRVRFLVEALEKHPSIALACPFNKPTKRDHRCRTYEEVEKVKRGSLEYLYNENSTTTSDIKAQPDEGSSIKVEELGGEEAKANEVKDKTTEDEKFLFVYTSSSYIGLELKEGAKSLDLEQKVNEFRTSVADWHLYNEELNDLSVTHCRNWDLPDDLFEEGEVKPLRPAKKPKKRVAPKQEQKAAASSNKRSVPETSSDTASPTAKRQQTSVAAAG